MATTFPIGVRRCAARAIVVTVTAAAFAALPSAAPTAEAAAWLPARCKTGRVVCVDKSTRTLRLVVGGKVKLSMKARFGSRRTPTREGTFRIYWKDIDHVSSVFGSAMPFSLFFSGGQAIHYSSDFAAVGYNGASHGCVNTRSWSGMRALYRATRVGDRVVIYWS